jgi:hypothetical protein
VPRPERRRPPRLQARDPERHARLAERLAATPFVLARDGGLRRPGELYDPDQQLFGDVLLPLLGLQRRRQLERSASGGDAGGSGGGSGGHEALAAAVFPAAPFDSPRLWLPILRDCGLVSQVDLPGFLRLAWQFADVAAAAAGAAPPAPPEAGSAGAGPGEPRFVDLSGLPPAEAQQLLDCGGALVRHLAAQHVALLAGASAEQRAVLARLPFAPATFGLPGGLTGRRAAATRGVLLHAVVQPEPEY